MLSDCWSSACSFIRYSRDPAQIVCDDGVSPIFEPGCNMSICRSSMRRIVFEAAEARWIVRRRDDYAIRKSAAAASVVAENRMRDHRRGCIAVSRIDHDMDVVAGQHLQCTLESRSGESVRVETDV